MDDMSFVLCKNKKYTLGLEILRASVRWHIVSKCPLMLLPVKLTTKIT